ncbi:MAG: helix-turn-helix transcriptional regulator [Candidatus Goldbacteria bacterium]|nr:helix-turn-helix transcriptional regulator [Candidatus Goldiibacteriota bacterium]
MIKDNILSTKLNVDNFGVYDLSAGISLRARTRRLELNLSQSALSSRSGVSLGTLKRFERSGEISLKHLLMLAAALKSTKEFNLLFTTQNYATFEEAVSIKKTRKRKRGRIND